jgi:hypothetical protein
MSTAITLAELTLESAEIEEGLGNPIETPGQPSPIHTQEFDDMMLVFETYETIVKRKYVCRSDMENIKALLGTYPALGKLVDRYPINSFTQEPSRVNYDVSTESFAKTAYEAVVSALASVLAYVINAITNLWAWFSTIGQSTQAIDDRELSLVVLQRYMIEVDKILANSEIQAMARRVRDGAASNELRNINGKWNSFKDKQFHFPEKQLEEMNILAGVIRTKLPPFVEAVDMFLIELSKAETESDVDLAIVKLELFDINSAQLFALATSYGYVAKDMNINKKLTSFQSLAMYIKGSYKSLLNERGAINEEDFKEALISYKPTKWAEVLNNTISRARGRTDPVLKKVKEFNNGGLKPGLEEVYTSKLVPFLKALASVLTGFVALSESMGYLTDTRNQVSYALCKASLNVVKKIDSFTLDNKSKLSIIENSSIASYRREVSTYVKQ